MKYTLEERIERARVLHKQGYNCSQCVVMVFDDIHELDEEVIARVSAGFGGGVGGMRQVCGAVSGMTMITSLVKYVQPSDKPMLYAEIKSVADEFKTINGSIVCGELLRPGRKPCIGLIEDAITIIDARLR
ncbi:MAG: C_GCAxxG_C_C family protein [Muribaculaceae bacterium]|nr:C_GCAxxG_C_C family protein [Muribaculaceae bacterium]